MKLKKILLVSIAASAVAIGMLFTQSCNSGDELSPEEIASLKTKYDSIMVVYENMKVEYAELENTNARNAEDIRVKDSIINAQAKEIRNCLNNGGRSPKLAKKVDELQKQCEDLTKELEALRAENQRLKEENRKAQEDLASADEIINRLNADNAEAKQKLAAARVLLVNDLTATPEKKKCGGKNFKATNKATSVERIHIAGKILPNNVVDPGTKTFYARVAKGSNLVTNAGEEAKAFDMDGVEMLYTIDQDIEFYGQGRAFSMVWRKAENTKLEAGVYTVTLYNNGNEIGKTNFTLK